MYINYNVTQAKNLNDYEAKCKKLTSKKSKVTTRNEIDGRTTLIVKKLSFFEEVGTFFQLSAASLKRKIFGGNPEVKEAWKFFKKHQSVQIVKFQDKVNPSSHSHKLPDPPENQKSKGQGKAKEPKINNLPKVPSAPGGHPQPTPPVVHPKTEAPKPIVPDVSQVSHTPKPEEPKAIDPSHPAHVNLNFADIPKDKQQKNAYDATKFGFKEEEGKGFPVTGFDVKNPVIEKSVNRVKELTSVIESNDGNKFSFSEEGRKIFNHLVPHIKFYAFGSDDKKLFLAPGNVVQQPVRMEYDESFKPIESKNYFYMHSTPAPNGNHFNFADEEERNRYLDSMRIAVKGGLKAQIDSGSTDVIWNYFALGAFIRNVKVANKAEQYEIRKLITCTFVQAFDEVLDGLNADQRSKLMFHLTGPTGGSFKGDQKKLKPEVVDNYNAFVLAFNRSKYKSNVTFRPETDAFIFAQSLADKRNREEGEVVAPISVMNAADPKALGNRWYKTDNANFAIDENGHRRAPESMGVGSFWVNGGWRATGTCAGNIAKIRQMANVDQP